MTGYTDCHFHGFSSGEILFPQKEIISGINCFYSLQHIETLLPQLQQGFFFSAGIHPWYCKSLPENWEDILKKTISLNSIPFIGEIGLHGSTPDPLEIKIFSEQLKIADSLRLPVILHSFKNTSLLLSQLKKFRINSGMIHRFSGSLEEMNLWLKQGFSISFGLNLLHSPKLQNLFVSCPIDKILLETDHDFQTKKDYPLADFKELYYLASSLKNFSPESLKKIIQKNLKNLVYP